jgi:pyrimidine deaminase RibD-like protein
MDRALELAERGRGTTYPNPVVGAVVVTPGGTVVGEGWHERAGGPHAEVVALRAAGGRAKGATLYVTLEPCARFGRTPPCVDAIVGAGIARVVVGARDPSQDGVERSALGRHRRGRARPSRGRAVERGLAHLGDEAAPFVTYKVAATVDGRVTLPGSRWISGEESRRLVHELRRRRMPWRSGWVRCARTIRGSTRVTFRSCGSRGGSRSGWGRCRRGRSSSCCPARPTRSSAAWPRKACSRSSSRAARRSRPAFLERDLIDKLLVFVAPALSGSGPRLFGDFSRPVELMDVRVRSVGADLLLEAYIHEP